VVGDCQDQLQKCAEQLLANPKQRAMTGQRGRVLVERLFSPDTAMRQVMVGMEIADS